MVRLRLYLASTVLLTPFAFQSHNGSIKALVAGAQLIHCLSFNPTMVRLRLNFLTLSHLQFSCFNPTMVRLRLCCRLNRESNYYVSIPQWFD